MLVIETSISYDENKQIADHQSRIIEVDNWESYIAEFIENKSVNRNGTLYGNTITRMAKVIDLKFDDKHLSCELDNGFTLIKKLSYRIHESYSLIHGQ